MAYKRGFRSKLTIWAGIGLISLIYPYTTPCCAFFTGIKNEVRNEVHSIKDSQTKEFSDIKAGINDVSVSLGKIETNLNAQAQVQAKIQMGVDKSNTQSASAGRDITTTNDSVLMKFIFDKIIYVIGLIIGLIGVLVASYERLLKTKQVWISNLVASNNEKDEKNDKWFQEKLGKVLNGGGKL